MKTLLSERGQVVIPKKVREALEIEKGDELDVKVVDKAIVLTPLKRFKANRWQDYVGIGEGIVDAHLKEKKAERKKEDVYP
ncbi:MAG: AbrB/MazE/SpoVT family DNA-binding domain-containing protein [Nitrospirae bacterium]|nr:AbrB/MazE/SpoVT family DNA-binding domain-containing protein [Nitrospirota bacterium]